MATAAAHLEPHFTVHAIDRRGRGASGDAPDYALEREFEDVAAVVDRVATAARGPVHLYGHSHGGLVAFGAATVTANIDKLFVRPGSHTDRRFGVLAPAQEWRASRGATGRPTVRLGSRVMVRRVDLAAIVGLGPDG